MGEAKRRKALGIGFKKIDPKIQLASEAQLYKKTKELRPDLGMALALLEYTEPLVIGCCAPTQTGDIMWDVSIAGILNSYGRIGNERMPPLPWASESYFFTIALNHSTDEFFTSDIIDALQNHSLVVRIEPKYKYLTPNKKEWVLPLVPVSCAMQA